MTSPAAAAADTPAQERFFGLLDSNLARDRWLRLVLARPHGAEEGLQRVTVRPLSLRGEACLSFLYSYERRDITKNLPVPAGLVRLHELLGPAFRNAHLFTPAEEIQLVIGKKGQARLTVTQAAHAGAAAPATHNREKQRWLALTRPFLVELGVTTAQHQLVPAMSRKWRQINKFVEIFSHALASSSLAEAPLIRVADFGSGKGYLTFAVHDWLCQGHRARADVVGVELRGDMVALGNSVVGRLGLQGLRFEQGDLRSHAPGPLDVMIALHACDVATDHAIHLGLRAGAQVILCSPCCHKQVRPQLLSPHPLRPVLQHGVHLEQEAEMLTDSLRALLLESQGYETQVFEFISLEHTSKNKMILAVKRRVPRAPEAVLAQIDELKRFYGIREQCLETLLMADAAAAV